MNDFFDELRQEALQSTGNICVSENTTRILAKLDKYLSENDYRGAEGFLVYCLTEARQSKNHTFLITVLNEIMGLFRKTNQKEKALNAAKEALNAVENNGLKNTVTDATVSLNAATVYKAFGENEKAVGFYRHAQKIYESTLAENDARLAGLYNNTGLALTAVGEFREAKEMYNKAVEIMTSLPNGNPEAAITYLNLADLCIEENGFENGSLTADEYVNRAMTLLDSEENIYNGNYAFVCEKCASVFEYYGYFSFAEELQRRSKEIYEGT